MTYDFKLLAYAIAFFAVALILKDFIHHTPERYGMVGTSQGPAYYYDKQNKRAWLLLMDKATPVKFEEAKDPFLKQ